MTGGDAALLEIVQVEYALPARSMTLGGRGALAEIWRVELDGGAELAVKVLGRAPSEALVAKEVAYTQEMIGHGVRAAASITNRHGGYLSRAPRGWVRVLEWIHGAKPDPADPRTPLRLGEVLGRMHAHAVPMTVELGGGPQHSWYHQPPDMATLANLIAAAESSDPRWAGRLEALLPTLHNLCAIRKAPEAMAKSMVLCHRDLHPDNALLTPEGQFAVLDWDNLGPADPAQELASTLLHWFADHPQRSFHQAYRAAGGTATLTAVDDFAMHIATSLNFLALQLKTASDPRAVAEIEESIQLMPSIEVLERAIGSSHE